MPEDRDNTKSIEWTFSRQVSWETEHLEKATVVLFWIPRDLEELPGFTTNIEFGEYMKSGKIVIGSPLDAPKMSYLKERCSRLDIPWNDNLAECASLVMLTINQLKGSAGRIFFTADTHFGHQRVLEMSRRPFKSVEEMSWTMVKNWNSVIGDNDIVFHLGDFGDPAFIRHLGGKEIRLLPGNYDTGEVLGELETDKRVNIISQGSHTLKICDIDIRLTHAPEDARGANFFLYGHIHHLQMVKKNGLNNVGVDCHQYTPVNVNTVEFYVNAILKHYDQNVFLGEMGK